MHHHEKMLPAILKILKQLHFVPRIHPNTTACSQHLIMRETKQLNEKFSEFSSCQLRCPSAAQWAVYVSPIKSKRECNFEFITAVPDNKSVSLVLGIFWCPLFKQGAQVPGSHTLKEEETEEEEEEHEEDEDDEEEEAEDEQANWLNFSFTFRS